MLSSSASARISKVFCSRPSLLVSSRSLETEANRLYGSILVQPIRQYSPQKTQALETPVATPGRSACPTQRHSSERFSLFLTNG